MLIFLSDNRRFAIDTSFVEGVVVAEEIGFLPYSQPPVIGIITYRTELVVVADLKSLFSTKGRSTPPFTMIILNKGGRRFALCIGDTNPRFVNIKDCAFISNGQEPSSEPVEGKIRYRGLLFDLIEPEALYKKILESFQ